MVGSSRQIVRVKQRHVITPPPHTTTTTHAPTHTNNADRTPANANLQFSQRLPPAHADEPDSWTVWTSSSALWRPHRFLGHELTASASTAMPVADLKSCSVCEVSVHLGCTKPDERVFDRVIHCLLPIYPLLALAAEREPPNGFTCLVGQKPALYPFLDALFTLDAARFGFVPEELYNRTACVPLPDVVVSSPLAPAPMRLLHRSVRMHIAPQPWPAPPAKRQLLLLVRSGTRSFVDAAGAASRLAQRLQWARVVQHHGTEPMREQVQLFANSSSVVGIHGAGLANLVFNIEPVCVVEINTYMSSELQGDGRDVGRGAGPALWRTNAVAALSWNAANVRWHTYRVPVNQLVTRGVGSLYPLYGSTNSTVPTSDEAEEVEEGDGRAAAASAHAETTSAAAQKVAAREQVASLLKTMEIVRKKVAGKRDRYVKRLSYVLYEHDLDNVAGTVASCIDGVAAARAPMGSMGSMGSLHEFRYHRFPPHEMDTQRTVAEIVQADGTNFTQEEHHWANQKATNLSHMFI